MSKPNDIQLVVVEDLPVIREGLVRWLDAQEGMRVIGLAADHQETRNILASGLPNVLILDLMMAGGGDGTLFVEELKNRYPSLRILVFSIQDEMIYAERVIRAGANGYVMKREAGDELLQAIRTVAEGDLYVSRKLSAIMVRRLMQPSSRMNDIVSSLTDRELHVFQLIGSGMNPRKIAEQLSLSVKTIEAHRENIKNKLNLHTAAQVIQRATIWFNEQAN